MQSYSYIAQKMTLVRSMVMLTATSFLLIACGGSSGNGGNAKPIKKIGDSINEAKAKTPKTGIKGDVIQLHRLSDQGLPLTYRFLEGTKPEYCDLNKNGYSVTLKKSLNKVGVISSCSLLVNNGGGNARINSVHDGIDIDVWPKCSAGQINHKSGYCMPKKTIITSDASTAFQTEVGSNLVISLEGYNLSEVKNQLKIITPACAKLSEIVVSDMGYRGKQQIKFSCTPKTAGNYQLSVGLDKNLYKGNIDVTLPQVIGGSKQLNKTGVTLCDNETDKNLTCTLATLGNIWFGLRQDGEVQAGNPLSYSKKQYSNKITDQTDSCIQDNSTGLVWEIKSDDGLQDKNWQYYWYNTNTANNGNVAGQTGSGIDICGGHLSACNSQAYIAKLNKNNYCGYNDWRLPEISELINLVDYGREKPSIDPIFSNIGFSQTEGKYGAYMSNTTIASFGYGDTIGVIEFESGSVQTSSKDFGGSFSIRAVRADSQ